MRKFTVFGGRTSQAKYWWFVLALVIGSTISGFADYHLFPADPARCLPDRHPATVFFGIVMLLPMLSAGIRRLHDVNRRGWWFLMPGVLPLALTTICFALLWAFSQALEEITTLSNPRPQIVAVIGAITLSGLGSAIYLIMLLAYTGENIPNRFGPPPDA